MSFSVKAGPSTPPESISGHLHQALPSPVVHSHISPQLLPQSSFSLSNFSLNDEYTSASALLPSSVATSTMTGMPTPPITNTNPSLSTRRPGTDPAKYKTTICRNWEQTGVCNFRGCTFAHGVEELRAPVRSERHTPHLHFQRMSQGSTPPQIPSQLALSSVSAANNINIPSNTNNNNNNNNSSMLLSAIASGINSNTVNAASHTSYHNSYGNSNTNNNNNSSSGGSNSGGGNSSNNISINNSNNSVINMNSTSSGSSNLPRLEQLMEMLYVEIRRQEALVAVHMEANRTLEAMLHREQALHTQTQVLLEEKKMECHQLLQIINEQEMHLQQMCNVGDSAKAVHATYALPNISTSVGGLSTSEESTSHSHQRYQQQQRQQQQQQKQEQHHCHQEQYEKQEEEKEEQEEEEEACELVQAVQRLETARQQQQEEWEHWEEHLSSRDHEEELEHEEHEPLHEQYLYEPKQVDEHNSSQQHQIRLHHCTWKREKNLLVESEDMQAMIDQTAQLVQQMHDMSNKANNTEEEQRENELHQQPRRAELSNLQSDEPHDDERNLEELLVTLQKEEETFAHEDKRESNEQHFNLACS